jgi:peptidoglycan/xylan/chitin deacetylase (PgdA/CDA1 family)
MKRTGAVLALLTTALLVPMSSLAAECPDNPEALGTSRVMAVNPRAFPMVGRAQYRESLRLNKREVVLTFDNGPSYPYTESILKTLAAECVKATFFALGGNVAEDPDQLRRIAQEGHGIGSQTFNHVSLAKLPIAEARKEIDEGIKALGSALHLDPTRVTRFFRAPMLDLTPQVARHIISRGMMVWGVDVDSLDWDDDTSEEKIVDQTIKGLERSGGGIVALQDIQPRTARALPLLLEQLKIRKFRIVHVVPRQPQASVNETRTTRAN